VRKSNHSGGVEWFVNLQFGKYILLEYDHAFMLLSPLSSPPLNSPYGKSKGCDREHIDQKLRIVFLFHVSECLRFGSFKARLFFYFAPLA
jgi:hypothetical protein